MIDLRSDTVTRPGPAMRAAMAQAPLGDDVYGEDPTVNRLQARGAELFDMEAALFLPTGTQSNLCAHLVHCQRGDEYIAGQDAHTYSHEGGGGAVLGSIQPQPLTNQPDGSLALADIEAAIKPDDSHFARTRLITLENTIGGKVLSRAYLEQVLALAARHKLATHLDGARVFNAAVSLGLPVAELCRGFDTVSACLSKGLGAPAGTLLIGRRELIHAARRWRKMLGGGMRQAGVLAAAGLYALDHHIDRLKDDHGNAARLAAGLAGIESLAVEPAQTNMVFINVAPADVAPLAASLQARGVLASIRPRTRLVTHLDLNEEQVNATIGAFAAYFARA